MFKNPFTNFSPPSTIRIAEDTAFAYRYLTRFHAPDFGSDDEIALLVARLMLVNEIKSDTLDDAHVSRCILSNPFRGYSATWGSFDRGSAVGQQRMACVDVILSVQQLTLFAWHGVDFQHSDHIYRTVTGGLSKTEGVVSVMYARIGVDIPNNEKQRELLNAIQRTVTVRPNTPRS